ncbi:lycopene cyclase domain-containing protein [Pedobacter sp. PWIIR3]
MKYTYLLIDFFTIIVPFVFSFHPKLNFYKTWKAFFPAVVITGLLFIAWDIYFTSISVWGFNPDYLIGVNISNLPVEEVLFFLCIPYSCVFTYHCLDLLFTEGLRPPKENLLTISLILIFTALGAINHRHIYPMVTFITLASLLVLAKYVIKVVWLGKFYLIYLVLLLPFFIVNGLLTGTGLEAPVVWYNSEEIIGIRLLTIPVEDIFYGMALILMNLIIYKRLLKTQV